MKIFIDSVRELAETVCDELLVVVDKIVLGEVCPRSIRQEARRRPRRSAEKLGIDYGDPDGGFDVSPSGVSSQCREDV